MEDYHVWRVHGGRADGTAPGHPSTPYTRIIFRTSDNYILKVNNGLKTIDNSTKYNKKRDNGFLTGWSGKAIRPSSYPSVPAERGVRHLRNRMLSTLVPILLILSAWAIAQDGAAREMEDLFR